MSIFVLFLAVAFEANSAGYALVLLVSLFASAERRDSHLIITHRVEPIPFSYSQQPGQPRGGRGGPRWGGGLVPPPYRAQLEKEGSGSEGVAQVRGKKKQEGERRDTPVGRPQTHRTPLFKYRKDKKAGDNKWLDYVCKAGSAREEPARTP